jgi:hypothetical protein
MPIDREIARKLCQDFLSMRMRPDLTSSEGKNQMRLIVDAIEAKARSISHAQRVHDSLMETCQFFPTVADIANACEYTPDDSAFTSLRESCAFCGGSGWRFAEGDFGVTAAYPCEHRSDQRPQAVRVSPEVARQYAAELTAGEKRRAERRRH